jgi:LPS sulfotransferase NodH
VRATEYIVAGTPRTGSNLLCEGLTATGVAGAPNEVFAPDFLWIWRARWGLPESVEIGPYVEAALAHGTSRNGVRAFKIQWMHVPPLARDLSRSESDVLAWLLPAARFVNVVRRDRRAQALSWFRAIATNQWWRTDVPTASAPPEPELGAVRELEAHIESQQAAWLEYFAVRKIVPLTVEYEALDQNYRGEVARVLGFLGLDPTRAAAIPRPRLLRQADGVTADWRRHLELAS